MGPSITFLRKIRFVVLFLLHWSSLIKCVHPPKVRPPVSSEALRPCLYSGDDTDYYSVVALVCIAWEVSTKPNVCVVPRFAKRTKTNEAGFFPVPENSHSAWDTRRILTCLRLSRYDLDMKHIVCRAFPRDVQSMSVYVGCVGVFHRVKCPTRIRPRKHVVDL